MAARPQDIRPRVLPVESNREHTIVLAAQPIEEPGFDRPHEVIDRVVRALSPVTESIPSDRSVSRKNRTAAGSSEARYGWHNTSGSDVRYPNVPTEPARQHPWRSTESLASHHLDGLGRPAASAGHMPGTRAEPTGVVVLANVMCAAASSGCANRVGATFQVDLTKHGPYQSRGQNRGTWAS
jgi:hypothetical protein